MKVRNLALIFLGLWVLVSCSSTEILESPKTAFVPSSTEAKPPAVVWSSRTLGQKFEYLGQITVRSWSYDGALERLVDAGQQMRADAVIDVHFERVGFLSSMHAFAVKFK